MQTLKNLIKEYPGTLVTFFLYIVLWSMIAMQLFDMHQNRHLYSHGETTYYLPLLGFILAFIYLLILIIVAFVSKTHRHFNSRLAMLASIPIVVVIVIAINEAS